jgi:hypothetical protein
MVLGGIKYDLAQVGGMTDAVYGLAPDACKLDGVVKSTYDATIAVCICQLVYTDSS